jgi:hypothetical protein
LAAILDGAAKAPITPRAAEHAYEVEVRLEVHDNHRGDSPDVGLNLTVVVRHPRLPVLTARVPIPVEGEVAGISAAKDDLRNFAERERFPIELPMLVVGGAGSAGHSSEEIRLRARVSIDMVPYRQVANL